MSGGGGDTVTKSEPWDEAKPYLLDGLDAANALYKSDPSGLDRIAPQHPLELASEQALLGRIGSGLSASNAQGAQGALNNIFSRGSYGGTDALMDNIETNVMPRVNAQFSGAGRTGSGLHQDTATRAMTEAAAPVLAQLYENETQNQLRGAALAPSVDLAAMGDIRLLQALGEDRRAEEQMYLDAPRDALADYYNFATSAGGQGGTVSQSGPKKNRAAGVLGGAATGAAAGSAAGPYGALIGGVVGGGLGLFA